MTQKYRYTHNPHIMHSTEYISLFIDDGLSFCLSLCLSSSLSLSFCLFLSLSPLNTQTHNTHDHTTRPLYPFPLNIPSPINPTSKERVQVTGYKSITAKSQQKARLVVVPSICSDSIICAEVRSTYYLYKSSSSTSNHPVPGTYLLPVRMPVLRSSAETVQGQNGPPLAGRCPFRPPSTHYPTGSGSTATTSPTSAVTTAVGAASGSGRSSSSNFLDNVVAHGGKSKARTVGEARGKRLLLADLRLDGYPTGGGAWTYKVSVNQEHHLPPKRVPKWTVWLELPVGKNITLEVQQEEQRQGGVQ